MRTRTAQLMDFKLLAKWIVAAATALAPLPGSAQSLTDLWFTPAEPGWGLSIQHQRDTLFVVLFVYSAAAPGDPSGKGSAQWFVAPDMKIEIIEQFSQYRGKLYSAMGSPYAAAFDPAATQLTEVGEMAIIRDTPPERDGRVTYRIGSTQVTKPIRRMSFAGPDLAGTYLVTMSGGGSRSSESSNCPDAPSAQQTRRETWTVDAGGPGGSYRLTRQGEGVATATEPIEVRQAGSTVELRFPLQTPPVNGQAFVQLDHHNSYGWLGFFRGLSTSTVVVNLGGTLVTLPECRFDATFTATRVR